MSFYLLIKAKMNVQDLCGLNPGRHKEEWRDFFLLFSLTPQSSTSSSSSPPISPPPSTPVEFSKPSFWLRSYLEFPSGSPGGALPLLPNAPPLSGLGSPQRRGAPHLAPQARLLALHLDLRGEHAGEEASPVGHVDPTLETEEETR